MLLTISLSQANATEFGYLLHKNPARVHSFNLAFGKAHVFYPEISPERCTAALLLDVDPVGLVRGRQGPPGEGGALEQYVNDRPYAASSFLSVAIAQVFGTALGGRSKERPELANAILPLEARLPAVPCRGGKAVVRMLFEPLGYEVGITEHPLDPENPDWGSSRYLGLSLKTRRKLCDLLSHLYVLVPVLDDEKHYWVGTDEVEKLLRHGEGWLKDHPEREFIARRYLRHQKSLFRMALDRLLADETPDADQAAAAHAREEEALEQPLNLNDQRLGTVLAVLKIRSPKSVLDLGCGEGKLLRLLSKERGLKRIVGVDVSIRALEVARDRLRLDRVPDSQKGRIQLVHGSLLYRDRRLEGFDAAAVVEVIEHLDAPRLAAFERVVFEFARPGLVAVTTPNAEYNVKFEGLPPGKLRHRDHRFEWSRAEFEAWAKRVAMRFGYGVRFLPVGPEDAVLGAPTQMGVFER